MRGSGKVRKSLSKSRRIRCLHQHKRHARPEEYNVGGIMSSKKFSFEVSEDELTSVLGRRA